MKKLSRLQKSIIGVSSTLLLLFISIYIYFYPPPWNSWEVEDVTQTNTMNTSLYFNTKHWRCGDLRYENNKDCEFALLVQNSKSDTLFYEVMKHVTGKPRYGKKREFYIGPDKHLTIKYIPINVPKEMTLKLFFSTSHSCDF